MRVDLINYMILGNLAYVQLLVIETATEYF